MAPGGSLPKNGIYIVQGEQSVVVTAMTKSFRSSYYSNQNPEDSPLLSNFAQLKETLGNITDLADVDPNVFISPFLEVIRSEDTTGPVTGLALTAVGKFITYGLIDPSSPSCSSAVENIADSITHARFMGTDAPSDETVLMRILDDLLALLRSPVGCLLTNESVCEIVQSCFRICFEMRLSELLRKFADSTLMAMVHLLFSRLPEFKDDPRWSANVKKLKMRTLGLDPGKRKKDGKGSKKSKRKSITSVVPAHEPVRVRTAPGPDSVFTSSASGENKESPAQDRHGSEVAAAPLASVTSPVLTALSEGPSAACAGDQMTESVESAGMPFDTSSIEGPPSPPKHRSLEDSSAAADTPGLCNGSMADKGSFGGEESPSQQAVVVGSISDPSLVRGESQSEPISACAMHSVVLTEGEEQEPDTISHCESVDGAPSQSDSTEGTAEVAQHVNPKGVKFIPQAAKKGSAAQNPVPYGLPCIRELFRFLISVMNPLDKHNNEVMIHTGLSLLTVALETAADHFSRFDSLLYLVKDDLCYNLFRLLHSDSVSLFAASQRVCFLLFESMRSHLKYQLEMYITKLMEIVTSDSPRVHYEQKETSLESIMQLWKVPGLVTELFLNYDCDPLCSNLFADITKLLSKNSFPVSGLFNTHLLSLDALLAVVDSIEQHCHTRILESRQGEALCHSPVGPMEEASSDVGPLKSTGFKRPYIKPNRLFSTDTSLPSQAEIQRIRNKKKLIHQGIEEFNIKHTRGIAFLQKHGIMSEDPVNIVQFLREHAGVDKAMLGEFLTRKDREPILLAFIQSFDVQGKRVDEALRGFLETFRLPGESPVIEYLMERFARLWHDANGQPFHSADAAFTLIYAVIMLNVDQHNQNAKKQNPPMTNEQFKRNLKRCNGDGEFDHDMLDEIFKEISSNEIVMPQEQKGIVKENYLWKELLRKSGSDSAEFLHAPTGSCDRDLFGLIWAPTVAALASVFDKSTDTSITQRSISGFRKFAMISAHYGMCEVFDHLIISLCKFTTLLNSTSQAAESGAGMGGGTGAWMVFGMSAKAQLAARTVFELARQHGDILREGWENILSCVLTMYQWKLVPTELVEADDFLHPDGKISLHRKDDSKENQKADGVLNALYNYFGAGSGGSEGSGQKALSEEEEKLQASAKDCVQECALLTLLEDTKFLTEDSLQELVKALIRSSGSHDRAAANESGQTKAHHHGTQAGMTEEDGLVFNLELLIRVALCNRDRVGSIWHSIRDHFTALIVHATECSYLVERAVCGLVRLVMRLLCREDIASLVLPSLHVLLLMKPSVARQMSRQLTYGLHQLLETNAANIHASQDWYVLLTLLEVGGAGGPMPDIPQALTGSTAVSEIQSPGTVTDAMSDSEIASPDTATSDRGYTSDGDLGGHKSTSLPDLTSSGQPKGSTSPSLSRHTVGDSGVIPSDPAWGGVGGAKRSSTAVPLNQFRIFLGVDLVAHDSKAMLKAVDSLQLLIRDAAHVTPYNFETCVHTVRLFVEANVNGGALSMQSQVPESSKGAKRGKSKKRRKEESNHSYHMTKSRTAPAHLYTDSGSATDDPEALSRAYTQISLQLLDLTQTLHTQAANIFSSWAAVDKEEGVATPVDDCATNLWNKCWCPLLQGIARLCCDVRKEVQIQALACLERALIVNDLNRLSGPEWEDCFNKVLFPLLSVLLEGGAEPNRSGPGHSRSLLQDPVKLEESRYRASRLLGKVFLLRLQLLLPLPTFTALWLTILDFMDKYMNADKSDFLYESIPESLKNMLLVMNKDGVFDSDSAAGGTNEDSELSTPATTSERHHGVLWQLTWDRISTFLPNLRKELFHEEEKVVAPPVQPTEVSSPAPATADVQPLPSGQPSDTPTNLPLTAELPLIGTTSPIGHSSPVPTLIASNNVPVPTLIGSVPPAPVLIGPAPSLMQPIGPGPGPTLMASPVVGSPSLIATPTASPPPPAGSPPPQVSPRLMDGQGSSLVGTGRLPSGSPFIQLHTPLPVGAMSPLVTGELSGSYGAPPAVPYMTGTPPASTHVASPQRSAYSNTAVSLLLDPGIMQGTKIPVLSTVSETTQEVERE